MPIGLSESLARGDEVASALLIVAHPDDEVIGIGGHLAQLRGAVFAHITDGSPRDGQDSARYGFENPLQYAKARRQELEHALAMVGVKSGQLVEFNCPDQQASHQMAYLAEAVTELILDLKPQYVLTHPYEGGHPDHDATAFAVHAACKLMSRRTGRIPTVYEISAYHMGHNGLESFCFIPSNAGGEGHETVLELNEPQKMLKKAMFNHFPTQQETLQYFPIAVECLRPSPQYDFTRPPHEGTLFYEQYPWGMTGRQFTELASQAAGQLRLGEVM